MINWRRQSKPTSKQQKPGFGRKEVATDGVLNGVETTALQGTIDEIANDAAMGACKFRTTNKWITGGHSRARIKEFYAAKEEDASRATAFFIDMDEPPLLAGENRGSNPAEVLLAALSGCVLTTLVYNAALQGITVNEARVEIEGDIDLRGMFDLDKNVRPGYQDIRLKFHLDTDATPEQEAALIKIAREHSPVYNSLQHAVPMTAVKA